MELEDYQFNPEEYLINILLRAVANKQDVSVSTASGDKVAIFPARGDYYSFVDDMAAFCTSNINDLVVKVLTDTDSDELRKDKEHGRNFDELLWQASYYASQGRLIEGCRREDVVELRYWPNLTRLPGPPSSIAIAALLTRYPTSVTLAGRILGAPMSEMLEFYSAAYSAGFIKVHNRSIESHDLKPHKLKPHSDSTMLGKLLSRISRI